MYFKIALFTFLSLGLIVLSWDSLKKDRRSHGFYRFFAFEALLVLFLLNVDRWFENFLSFAQLLSWVLLTASLILAISGFVLLRTLGNPDGKIEDTTILVKEGIYGAIRHPLYGSLMLFGWGVFFKGATPLNFVLILVASGALYATAKAEERENLDKFGSQYADYKGDTKMFIPFLW